MAKEFEAMVRADDRFEIIGKAYYSICVCFLHQDIAMAKEFEAMVRADARFEIIGKVQMGLVCFRVKVGVQKCSGSLLPPLV